MSQSLKTYLGDDQLKVSLCCVTFFFLVLLLKMSFEALVVMFMCSLQEFINFTLHYIADLDIPIKRSVRNPVREFPRTLALY